MHRTPWPRCGRGCDGGVAVFLVFNVVAVIKGLIGGQLVLRAVIGRVLPFVIAYAFMALMEIWPI